MRLIRIAPALAIVVLAITATVLTAIALRAAGIPVIAPALFVMKTNTALGLSLLAVALVGLWLAHRRLRAAAAVCTALAAVLAGLTLVEYVLGVDLRIDQLLVHDPAAITFPGRPSAPTSAGLLLIAAAYGMLWTGRARTAQMTLVVASATPLATLGAYLYAVPTLTADAPYPIVALHTSVALMLLCLGGLFVRADEGFMGVVVSDSMAGTLARRLLPLAAAVPMTAGLLVLMGERSDLFGVAFGSALLVTSCALLFCTAVWWTTSLFWAAERTRAAALLQNELAQVERQHILDALQVEEAKVRTALDAERLARAEAEQVNRTKDEFLATLSHELRTPLNAVLGWTQIARNTPDLSDDLGEALEVIERNGRAQARIISDLLDMSGIVSGKVRLDVHPVSLPDVVVAAVQTVRFAADSKKITLTTEIDAPGNSSFAGDASRLQQVAWNVLSNAIKFTPEGGRVAVRLARETQQWRLTVVDSGIGIDPDFLPHVFDRFRQADASTTRRFGGLGLGLSIVKQLVELHGGGLTLYSDGGGHGTTVDVRLPLTPAPALTAGPASPAGATLRDGCPPDLNGLKILVVDDEPDARSLVRRMLEDCRAEVRTAGSAAEAMTSIALGRPDVLVSDIGMPGEDGIALIRRVRSLPPETGGAVPALALTAYAASEDHRRALAAGFQNHLAKPVDRAQLLAGVAALAKDLAGAA